MSVVRLRLYSDERIQKLILLMVKSGIKSLEPVILADGKVSYGVLDEVIEPSRAQVFLDSLSGAGIFQREALRKVLACPKHVDSFVFAALSCRKCGRASVERRHLLTHPKCGVLAEDISFISNDRMTCPRCKTVITLQVLTPMGSWYECEACHTKQDEPQILLLCRVDNEVLKMTECVGVELYRYTLTADAETEFKKRFPLGVLIANILEREGFTASTNVQMAGTSGVVHTIDVLARTQTGSRVAVITYVEESSLDEDALGKLLMVLLDINPEEKIIAAIPGATENAHKLARQYKVRLVAGADHRKIGEYLMELIQKYKDEAIATSRRNSGENYDLQGHTA